MKTYKKFIKEAARIVAFKDPSTLGIKKGVKVTKFGKRKSRGNKDRGKDKFNFNLEKDSKRLNDISNKYNAYTEIDKDFHVVDRFNREGASNTYNMDMIVNAFKSLENTSYFDDLDKKAKTKRDNAKIHVIDKKNKMHLITMVRPSSDPDKKYHIVLKSIMGDFSPKYIRNRRNKVVYV